MTMRRATVEVDGRETLVWTGGNGEPLLLLHGAWGGAESHWASVWDQLATAFRVIAPDFPGIADDADWRPCSLDESAQWVRDLLDSTGSARAWIVGNSFGAAVASRVASMSPDRCLGLVLVNGGPAPALPAAVTAVLRRRPFRTVFEEVGRRMAYSPSTPRRAFADVAKVPPEIRENVSRRRPRQLVVTTDILLAGDRPRPVPSVRTLVVWGAEDRLPGSGTRMAARLQRSLPDATLVIIANAGHLPQVEKPQEFVRAVIRFAAANATEGGSTRGGY